MSQNQTEAHEVQSVRKRVEGMGVENTPTEAELTTSWDAYADLHSPFACFAPRSNSSIFVNPSLSPPNSEKPKSPSPPVDPPLARAFAPSSSIPPPGSNPKFPSGADFFLKGKRNTPVGDSSPDATAEGATQNKKLKLPPTGSDESVPMASSAGSQARSQPGGFASYAADPSTSLRSKALEKLNSTPALQTASVQASSAISSFLDVHRPHSAASSACAVNGEPDDPANPPARSPATAPAFGFSAFASSNGFQDPAHPSASSSVFDQAPLPPSDDPSRSNPKNPDPAASSLKKTHLALSAELSQEDKHEGFLATEVLTGEENEDLVKSVRCKMFTLGEDGSWRERGTGGLRLLRTKAEPYRFRLIMRADAVLRVLLNVPIFKGFSYRPTQEKFLTFASTVSVSGQPDGERAAGASEETGGEPSAQTKFQQYLCRFGKPEARQEIIDAVESCLAQLGKQALEGDEQADAPDPDPSVDASDLV